MRKRHLTPDGWKPCNAFLKKCKYEKHASRKEVSALIDSAVKDFQQGNPDAAKNFLDNISGPLEKTSSKLNSIEETPSEIGSKNLLELLLGQDEEYDEDEDEDGGLDKVIQGDNGQYQVTCEDRWQNDARLIHKFGNFIKDEAIAKELHEADPHKRCQLGWCGPLAEGLLKGNEHVAGYYIVKSESKPPRTHIFVQLKDGTYADSLGIWTEEALFSQWKIDNPTRQLSMFDPNSPDYQKPDIDITEQDIFPVINELINKHMNGETL